MSIILTRFYPCPDCEFYNFSQVQQCEPHGGTCKWLLGLLDDKNTLQKIRVWFNKDYPKLSEIAEILN